MVEVLPDNGLITTLTGSILATDTTLTIPSVDAPAWPTSGEYRAVLWQDSVTGPWELVRVVSGQGSATLGVQRAAEPYHGGQTARAWPAGTGIAAVMTQDGLLALMSVTLESLFANTWVVQSANYIVVAPIMWVFATAAIIVTLPAATSTNRPITVVAITGNTTVGAASGSIIGGSINVSTGAVMNGTVSQGDSLTFKSDGANWRAT